MKNKKFYEFGEEVKVVINCVMVRDFSRDVLESFAMVVSIRLSSYLLSPCEV